MTGTEPLNADGSPPHHVAQTVKLEMEDKMVQIKKVKRIVVPLKIPGKKYFIYAAKLIQFQF